MTQPDAARTQTETTAASTWWRRAERAAGSPLGNAVLAGALGTVPARRLPRTVRRAWTAVPAAALAAAVAAHGRTQDPPWRVAPTAAAAVAGAALMVGVQQGGIAVDSRLESFVRRRGARHPRLVVGVVHGLVTLALGWASRRMDAMTEDADGGAPTHDGGAPA